MSYSVILVYPNRYRAWYGVSRVRGICRIDLISTRLVAQSLECRIGSGVPRRVPMSCPIGHGVDARIREPFSAGFENRHIDSRVVAEV